MNKREKLYEDIHNYTKYKLVEMLIEKHKDSKLDNLNAIEKLSDNVLDTLALCGLKFYSKGIKKK
tara:strand:+ start:219 stop:413 length:195 start_codon:yes stop_codon:yes gene_type:complete